MSAKASKESGNKFRCQIATRLRGGEVLSLADVNVIAKQHNLSLSAANTTFLNIESNSFATRTGLRAKRVRLGFGHSLVYEEGIDLQKTNISEKLTAMLTSNSGKPARPWLKRKIAGFAKEHGIPVVIEKTDA